MEEFFAARCATTYESLLTRERVGFPTVNASAEFFEPLVYGDVLEVEVFVSRVGRSSATFEYRLRREKDGKLCASATLVQVSMNLDERRSVPISENLRRAFLDSAQ